MTWSRLALAVGAVLVIGSFLLPYNDAGVGSAIAGRGLADLLLSGTVESWAPRWVGAVLYLIPLGGAVVLVGLGLGGRSSRIIIGVGIALASVTYAVFALALEAEPVRSPGVGSWLFLLGQSSWLAAAGLALARSDKRRSSP